MSLLESAASFSSLIAPVIDRTAISVHNVMDKGRVAALRGENRFHPGVLALFAGTLVSGGMSRDEYDELTKYQHFGSNADFLSGLEERGAVLLANGHVQPTPATIQVAEELVRIQAEAVAALFEPRRELLPEIWALISRAREAAISDASSPLSKLMGRAWLPADASDAARIWDASVVLRMHRADAHAAAWREAGLTAAEIRTMDPSPTREAIESRTNERAALAWEGLNANERVTLLSGLAALPGTGAPVP